VSAFPSLRATYRREARGDPLGELVHVRRADDDGLWRVAHSFNSTWLGWLVLVLRRHARSLSDLTSDEADVFGRLVPALSRALETELKVPKAYVLFLAEQEGFDHLHLHVIAQPPEYTRGIRVFDLIQRPSDEWVGVDLRQQLLGLVLDATDSAVAGNPAQRRPERGSGSEARSPRRLANPR
jgi:diadenosine tetraphosphate (Ap4A) HIT family hydrolase